MANGMPSMNTAGMGELFARLRFVFMALVVYRIGTHIPVPGIDPEQLAALWTPVFDAGALDFWITPVQMKKGRPGTLVGVLAAPEDEAALTRILLHATTTLGVRVHDVRRHDHRHPASDQALEGVKLDPTKPLQIMLDSGQLEVTVQQRVAVPGEVLAGGEGSTVPSSADEGRTHASDQIRITSERSCCDDRVVRVRVDVENR